MTRCGFVAIAGRPNVGKSTLVNRLVGTKVAVASDKPQTTRRAIRGIANGERDGEPYQLVLVDLPGVQRPRDELTERMQKRVERELADCDVALLVLNAAEGVGPGDRFIAKALVSEQQAGADRRQQDRRGRARADRPGPVRRRRGSRTPASTCTASSRSRR